MKNTPVPRLLLRGNVLPFLLLLVVALGWVNDVDASPTTNCIEDTMVLEEGELRVIANVTKKDYFYLDKTVYLWPEEGFRGIGLQTVVGTASGGNKSVDAWFSNSLFPAVNTSSWWQLDVSVTRTEDNVTFSVHLGDNLNECVSWVANDNIQSVEMGYSPSRWRDTEPPPGCPYQGRNNSLFRRQIPPTCTELPTATSPPEPTQTWGIVVAVVVVLVVVVMVAAVVVVVKFRSKHRLFTALNTH